MPTGTLWMGGILSGVIVGIVTGIASVWLSLFQFRAQQEWQRKDQAFRDVLFALHEMRITNEEQFRAEIEHREIPEDRLAALHERWRGARATIEMYADIGSVMLSQSAEVILRTLGTELRKSREAQTYFEVLDSDGYAVGIAMTAMKEVALAERRRVPTGWLIVPKWLRSIGTP